MPFANSIAQYVVALNDRLDLCFCVCDHSAASKLFLVQCVLVFRCTMAEATFFTELAMLNQKLDAEQPTEGDKTGPPPESVPLPMFWMPPPLWLPPPWMPPPPPRMPPPLYWMPLPPFKDVDMGETEEKEPASEEFGPPSMFRMHPPPPPPPQLHYAVDSQGTIHFSPY